MTTAHTSSPYLSENNKESTSQKQYKRLALVFFLSGMSSLLYQVSWQRILTIAYGVGSVSITLIVTIFMLGLGLGALLGGELASRYSAKSGRLYFTFELILGVYGLLSLPILQILGQTTSGAPIHIYCLLISLFLAIPTILMGATLPLLVESESREGREIGETVGELYCTNTLGACAGSLLSAYFLISIWGLDTAIYCASATNFILSAIFYPFLKRQEAGQKGDHNEGSSKKTDKVNARADRHKPDAKPIYLLAFVSGFVAIGLELCWFRTIEILVKSSPYAFASVLGVYLFGLAAGGGFIGKHIEKAKKIGQTKLYLLLQLGLALYVLVSYSLLNTHQLHALMRLSDMQELHPSFSLDIFHSLKSFSEGWFAWFDIAIWPSYFMLLPTFAMGASFPLLSSITAGIDKSDGKTVSKVYFVNVMGNVLGGICTGFLFFNLLGTSLSVLTLCIILISVFGLAYLKHVDFKLRLNAKHLLLLLPILLLLRYPSNQKLMNQMHYKPDGECTTYLQEGSSCVSMAYERDGSVWHWINGLAHGGRLPHMFGYYNRALEALSFAGKESNILVIGYGTGSIVEAVLRSPKVEKVTVVELNQEVMTNLKKMEQFEKLLQDKRIELVIDDGRRYLYRTNEKFDVVLMDPLRSSTAYSNNIYSAEFFKLVADHLNKQGILMVWLDNMTVIPKTIASQFNHVKLYKSFCLASPDAFCPKPLHDQRHAELLKNFSQEEVAKIGTEEELIGDEEHIKKNLASFGINTDLKPVTEYHLWH